MKYLLKKYWPIICFAIIVSMPLLFLGTMRTDKTITLKGDTTPVTRVIEIESNYDEQGSIATIYVVAVDHSTYLQNLFASWSPSSEVTDMDKGSLHYTYDDLYLRSKIMYESSITSSIVMAYNEAKKYDTKVHLDYTFRGIGITDLPENSQLKVGDLLYKIYDVTTSSSYACNEDYENFAKAFNEREVNDILIVNRNGIDVELPITTEDKIAFYGYNLYNVNSETATPKFHVNETNVGGPSGGFLQTLSTFNRLTSTDFTHGKKIAGTGTINQKGEVGIIGGIVQKVYTAFDDNIDIFFCPKDNYEEALAAYLAIPNHERMALVKVETLTEAIEYLANV